jgi:hypothetical protein
MGKPVDNPVDLWRTFPMEKTSSITVTGRQSGVEYGSPHEADREKALCAETGSVNR